MSTQISLLIAEDELLLQLAMQEALEGGGFRVATASSGDAAEMLLADSEAMFSGLIIDIRLGAGPNGWALARGARERNGNICVVYVTGDSAADWPAEGVPKSLILQKPFADAQLVTAISTLLNDQVSPQTLERVTAVRTFLPSCYVTLALMVLMPKKLSPAFRSRAEGAGQISGRR